MNESRDCKARYYAATIGAGIKLYKQRSTDIWSNNKYRVKYWEAIFLDSFFSENKRKAEDFTTTFLDGVKLDIRNSILSLGATILDQMPQ